MRLFSQMTCSRRFRIQKNDLILNGGRELKMNLVDFCVLLMKFHKGHGKWHPRGETWHKSAESCIAKFNTLPETEFAESSLRRSESRVLKD
jgi:hypothetical protein